MKYAVIESGGKQYKATEGGILTVDRLESKPGENYKFEKVLLLTVDGNCQIGQPTLTGVSVSGKVLGQIKDKKIRVAKFKAKSRYRRVQGHRQQLTTVQIEKIAANVEPKPKTEVEKKTTRSRKKEIKENS